MLLKIFLLVFSYGFLPVALCRTTETKITVGTSLDSMTRLRKGDVNKPPTEEFPTGRDPSDGNNYQREDHMFQADQPLNDDGFKTISVAPLDDDDDDNHRNIKGFNLVGNLKGVSSTIDPITKIRLTHDRNQRLKEIKSLIPVMIGRGNITQNENNNNSSNNIDISNLPPIEKIVSFLPKCNVPKLAKDSWKEDNLLYLYFNVTYSVNATLASAIIKLQRVSKDDHQNLNNNNNSGEEIGEKLLRVSIYWFSKQGKKQKIKKRLCDSKVVAEKQTTVELNVKPAIISWLDSQNLGFAVKVENQEEIALKASNYFKGDDCKTGSVQTYPTMSDLLANTSNDFKLRSLENYFLSTGILPIISICTVESITGAPLADKMNCQLHKTLYNEIENDGHKKIQSLIGNDHRLRHQKHIERNALKMEQLDIRNLMQNTTKVYSLRDELDLLNRQGVTR